MKILGINISHDASIAQITGDKIDFICDEPRFRRNVPNDHFTGSYKYWTPEPRDPHFMSIPRKVKDLPDHIAFATFDRRGWDIDGKKLGDRCYDRALGDDLMEFCGDHMLTRENLIKADEKFDFGLTFTDPEYDTDHTIAQIICEDQLDNRPYTLVHEHHHLYHAYCAHQLSPWRDEEVISIVWDGGGSNFFHEEYPAYQEMETIYRCTPSKEPKKQWQRLSNSRYVLDAGAYFPNLPHDMFWTGKTLETQINGVDYLFNTQPSMGMKFSQLSQELGCDDRGRAAGKVMGMASYSRRVSQNLTSFDLAQDLELEAFEYSCRIIENAIERNPDLKKIVLSGGYSLNCTNNYKYLQRFPDFEFFVDPVPSDGGTALGACLHTKLENS